MKVQIEARLVVPVTFELDVDSDTLGDISLGDASAIEEEVKERIVDAEGMANGWIELTVMDKKMNCYFDSEIGM